MLDLTRSLITSQYEASLRTLGYCIEHCPEMLWNTPVARYPLNQAAYHTLFFTDYYLSENETHFLEQPFHAQNTDLFEDYEQLRPTEPKTLYTPSQLQRYLTYCHQKAIDVVGGESADVLAAPAQFPRKPFSRAELHVYNIRHIQHHAAQIILRLRLDTEVDVPWFRNGWTDPSAS